MLNDKNDISIIDCDQEETQIEQWMPDAISFKDYDRQLDKLTFSLISTKWSEISSEDEFKNLMNVHAYLKDIEDKIEGYRKRLIEPYRKEVNDINASAKELTVRLDDMLATVKYALVNYCDKLNEDHKFKRLETDKCSVSVKQIYNFEVENPELIPRDFLMVDEDKIHALIKAGVRIIPGLKINKVNEIALRRK